MLACMLTKWRKKGLRLSINYLCLDKSFLMIVSWKLFIPSNQQSLHSGHQLFF